MRAREPLTRVADSAIVGGDGGLHRGMQLRCVSEPEGHSMSRHNRHNRATNSRTVLLGS